ncbi:MAG: hypothetical protein Q4G39_07845, partial [Brachymonas sp.]|nr:hypothetical protein [Brachymonas sp.]
ADSRNLSLDRYDMMRTSQINSQPAMGVVQPQGAPVLPPVRHTDQAWTPVTNPAKTPAPLMFQNMAPPSVLPQPQPQTAPVPAPTGSAAPVSYRAPVEQHHPANNLQSDYGLAWNQTAPQPHAALPQVAATPAPTQTPVEQAPQVWPQLQAGR